MNTTPNAERNEQAIQRAEESLKRAERDLEICRFYLAGRTLEEIGQHFGVKRQRIKQIVKRAGIWRPQAQPESVRDHFVGVTLSESDKTALRAEAERRGISMSTLTAELIKEMLAERKNEEPVEARP
jgi:hypothetical protein